MRAIEHLIRHIENKVSPLVSFKIDNAGLGGQWQFWMVILVPTIISGLMWWEISRTLTFNWSVDGFETFFKKSTLPLWILATSLPLGVLVARLFGTKQTALQIRVSQQDNRTKLFLAHYGFFRDVMGSDEEYICDKNQRDPQTWKVSLNSLYHKIYPKSNLANGVEGFNSKYFTELEESIRRALDSFKRAIEATDTKTVNQSSDIMMGKYITQLKYHKYAVNSLVEKLCLPHSMIVENCNESNLLDIKLEEYMFELFYFIDWYTKLSDFSRPNESVQYVRVHNNLTEELTKTAKFIKNESVIARTFHKTLSQRFEPY